MKKLLFVLLVLFLLSAPAVAQAHSDGKCKKDGSSCATTQDDGRRDGDEDRDNNGGRDRDTGDRDRDGGNGQGRDDRDQDGGNQGNDDDDRSRNGQDKDKDKGDDDDRGRDGRDSPPGDDGDDDRGRNDRDDKEKKDKNDKDDRGDRPGDDDGDTPGDEDDGEEPAGEEPGDDDDGSDDKPKKDGCTKINDGGITTLAGAPIVMGYDIWGYNYQAHSFNGWYENVDREGTPVEQGNIRFKMKWNDVYLSNKDCDGDGHLDRHQGYASYYGTRAWLTNTYMWSYIGDDGEIHWVHWFLKIVAQPYEGFNCASVGGTPFNSHFCVVKSEYRDPYGGSQGISALISGFGIGAK